MKTVEILASRLVDKQYSVPSVCRAINSAFFNGDINKSVGAPGIKIVVDGPNFFDNERPTRADLVTSGGCPPQKQENMNEFHFLIDAWSFDDIFKALKSLKQCSRAAVERIYDVTGGSIRLALKCASNAEADEIELQSARDRIGGVVKAQANNDVVKMAYYSTTPNADRNSLDRLRAMSVVEPKRSVKSDRPHFETTLVLASSFVARRLWAKLELEEVNKAMIYAKSTGNTSLFGWHFELWGHKLVETAIDAWQKEAARQQALLSGSKEQGMEMSPNPNYVQATGRAIDGLQGFKAEWLYWKPSVPNFANIDAAILLGDGTLLCLQFIMAKEHGFNMIRFWHEFAYNIPEAVQKEINEIKVIFVVPNDV